MSNSKKKTPLKEAISPEQILDNHVSRSGGYYENGEAKDSAEAFKKMMPSVYSACVAALKEFASRSIIEFSKRKEQMAYAKDDELAIQVDACIDWLQEYYEKNQHPDYQSVNEVMALDSIELLKKFRYQSIPSSIVRRLEESNPYKNLSPSKRSDGWNECVSELSKLLSAHPDHATLEYYPTGGIDKDVVGDFFYANKVENATVEVQEFKNSDTRLSLMLVDNRVKAYVIETRTAFNNVMFVKGVVGNSTQAAQPVEQGEVNPDLMAKVHAEISIALKPNKDGLYAVKNHEGLFGCKHFKDGMWLNLHPDITHWLMPFEIPISLLKQQS